MCLAARAAPLAPAQHSSLQRGCCRPLAAVWLSAAVESCSDRPRPCCPPHGLRVASGGSPFWLRCFETCWWCLQLPARLRDEAGLAVTLQVPLGFTQCSAASRLPPGAVLQPAASSTAGWGRGNAAVWGQQAASRPGSLPWGLGWV